MRSIMAQMEMFFKTSDAVRLRVWYNMCMEMDALKKFTKEELEYISGVCGNLPNEQLLLYLTAKLTEETGELAEAILLHIGIGQRKEKQEKYKKEDLEGEIADVIIVASMIAQVADVDIQKVLEFKTQKAISRRGSH